MEGFSYFLSVSVEFSMLGGKQELLFIGGILSVKGSTPQTGKQFTAVK